MDPRESRKPSAPPEIWALLALPVLAAQSTIAPAHTAEFWAFLGPLLVTVLIPADRRFSFAALAVITGVVLFTATENPRSAVVAVVLPLLIASCKGRWRYLIAISGLTSLVLLGSRGAIIAGVAGLATYALMASRHRRRMATLLALVSLTATWALLSWQAGDEPLWVRLALEDQAEGLSIDSVLGGRPEIWLRSLWIIEDAWPFALGPGGFETALTAYPGTQEVDHAHSWLLHVMVEQGPGGLALWLCLIARVAFVLWTNDRRQDSNSPMTEASITAGLLGSLLTFLTFGLADTLTGPASLVIWPILALVLRDAEPYGGPHSERCSMAGVAIAVAASLPLLIAGSEKPTAHRLLEAWIASETTDPSEHGATDLHWLRGLTAAEPEQQELAWRQLIEASPSRLPLLVGLWKRELESPDSVPSARASPAPTRILLSDAAVRRWPNYAEAWRLRAFVSSSTTEPANLEIEALRHVVRLSPDDASSWLRLADLLANEDPPAALEAYSAACVRGDPGANACLRGGSLAERLGAPLRARAFYRRSRWPPIRQRADQPITAARPSAAAPKVVRPATATEERPSVLPPPASP